MTTQINMQLITNELSIRNNQLPPGTFSINPMFRRNIGTINEHQAFTQIVVELKNTEDHPFPVDITADMTAIFEIDSIPQETLDDFLKHQAVHILLPYLRAMISSVTANSFMPAIVLPVFNALDLFPD